MEIFTLFHDLTSNSVYRRDWVAMISLQNAYITQYCHFFFKFNTAHFLQHFHEIYKIFHQYSQQIVFGRSFL